jgi:carbon storage regulator
MLILTRKPGDAILIDGGIRIVVLGVDARGVRLGIEAPTATGIVREEIAHAIADENRRAVAATRNDLLAAVAAAQPSAGSVSSKPPSTSVSVPS